MPEWVCTHLLRYFLPITSIWKHPQGWNQHFIYNLLQDIVHINYLYSIYSIYFIDYFIQYNNFINIGLSSGYNRLVTPSIYGSPIKWLDHYRLEVILWLRLMSKSGYGWESVSAAVLSDVRSRVGVLPHSALIYR